jgi:hypothetical protein
MSAIQSCDADSGEDAKDSTTWRLSGIHENSGVFRLPHVVQPNDVRMTERGGCPRLLLEARAAGRI